ncbi:hypothetical protein QOZ80_7AG0561610 [Eleusine coracana subsp. coracana]|nr:hypothetical protein QOZ80_7AG0561610 [Eleusine coracana subsp. coracana]
MLMASRCVAKPSGATTTTPRLSRRHIAANATSAPNSSCTARLPPLKKPSKPPPPLLSRPKLPVPVPTTTSDDTAGSEDARKTPSSYSVRAPPSSSGAGDVLRLLDALRFPPDEELYISLLRDCADTEEVAFVHAHIVGRSAAGGLPLPLANRVLLSYAACGDTGAARQVFDGMLAKNGMAWATMVSAYSDRCLHQDAMCLFAHMCREVCGLADDCYAHAIVAVLRSCARAGERRLSQQVHALIIKLDRVRGDVGSSLVQLYSEVGGLHVGARKVLMMMMQNHWKEPVSEAAWTSLITACHRDGLLNMAIDVFRDMVSAGVPRSSFSLSSILAVFAESQNHGWSGQQVHADAIKRGMDTNQFVGSGLVHLYAKQGQLADAARAFEAINGEPDAVCWNAMAMAYARGGRYREATRVMYQMKAAGMNPSEVMSSAVRSACFR